jgi:hypothetical protein
MDIARKYNKCTKLGEILDHGNDTIFTNKLLKNIFPNVTNLLKISYPLICYLNLSHNKHLLQLRKNHGYGTHNFKNYNKGHFIFYNILIHIIIKIKKSFSQRKKNITYYFILDNIYNSEINNGVFTRYKSYINYLIEKKKSCFINKKSFKSIIS